jgi:hypothetical protein
LMKPPILIRPTAPLTINSLKFNSAEMRDMIQKGYARAQEVLP